MQSVGNSFCGDVVSESLNKTSQDDDNNLDQKYKIKYVRTYHYDDFISLYLIRKCTNTTVTPKPNFMRSLLLCAVYSLNIQILQSLNILKIFRIMIPKDLLFIFLV